MIRRRAALAIAIAVLLCHPVAAQEAGRRYRVGVLDAIPMSSNEANVRALRDGLKELGYVEGRNLVLEYRSADGRPERFTDVAAELVRLAPDVIVTRGTSAALAAKHVTDAIPIVVVAGGDPVFAGLATTLARPGGNVTGLHLLIPPTIAATRLQLLKELAPRASRVGVFLDAGDVYARLMMREIEKAAPAAGIKLHSVETGRPEEFDRAFEAALLDRVDAVIVLEGVMTTGELGRMIAFAKASRLPAIYGAREFAEAGGLMAYGVDVRDLFRRSARYVQRILQGARPAELPMEAPTAFELVINLKTADALGVAVPPSLLRRADHVIR